MKPSNPTKLALKLSVLGMSAVLATTAFLAAPRYTAEAAWDTHDFDSYILPDNQLKDPANCTVNLIDYWATNATMPVEYNDESGVTNSSGINANHYLTFGAGDGAWNTYTQNANGSGNTFAGVGLDGSSSGSGRGKAYRGIVNYNLGDDGYPRLSLGEYAWVDAVKTDFNSNPLGTRSGGANESLAYLFDPYLSQNYRRGYPDVKGLFRYGGRGASNVDMTGYYWYDSTVNFAEMRATNEDTHQEFYYNTTSNENYPKNTSYKMRLYTVPLAGNGVLGTGAYAGQFFPLNSVNRGSNATNLFTTSNGMSVAVRAWTSLLSGSMNSHVNHFFGMSMEVEFMQPAGYNVDGKDMTFTFAGDDDVWIFCDDVLIADLGGNHNALACDVNFSTGEIVYYSSQQNVAAENDVWRVDYLSNCFGVDLDYGREVKGWYTEDGWTVPADDTALQNHYNNEYNGRAGWLSGRSGAKLDFSMATTNAWHAGVPATQFGTFEELTRHTLKFFFLESGGNMSNCMLKFNLSAIAE